MGGSEGLFGDNATGDAALAAAVFRLITVVIAALMNYQRAAGDVGKLQIRHRHAFIYLAALGNELRKVSFVPPRRVPYEIL